MYSSDDGNFFVFGGLGLAGIKAQEVVYDGDHKVSQLNWETKGMTPFTLGVGRQLDNDWSVKCSVEIGTSGNGHMVDYQWDSGGHNDWSDHSIHPLTELDHYFAGAIQLDRIIYGYETSSVTVGAGVRYTDIKWKRLWRVRHLFVRGWLPKRPLEGSRSGKRHQLPATDSYWLPQPERQIQLWRFYISADLQTGVSFGIKDDDHWLRFHDHMNLAPTLGATVALDYAMTPATLLYLSGSLQRVFNSRGETREVDTEDGTSPGWQRNAAGANFQSMSISFGLKATF